MHRSADGDIYPMKLFATQKKEIDRQTSKWRTLQFLARSAEQRLALLKTSGRRYSWHLFDNTTLRKNRKRKATQRLMRKSNRRKKNLSDFHEMDLCDSSISTHEKLSKFDQTFQRPTRTILIPFVRRRVVDKPIIPLLKSLRVNKAHNRHEFFHSTAIPLSINSFTQKSLGNELVGPHPARRDPKKSIKHIRFRRKRPLTHLMAITIATLINNRRHHLGNIMRSNVNYMASLRHGTDYRSG